MMRGGSCWSLSILSLWCHDRAALTSDTDVLATINRYSTESYSPNLGAGCAPAPLKIADVVGGLAHNGAGQVISGDALYGLYWVQNNGKTENGRKVDRPAEAFEDKLLDMLETFSSNTFVLSYQTTRSRSDAFGGAIAGDISLVSSGYFLIIGYAVSRMAFTVCSSLRHSTTAARCILPRKSLPPGPWRCPWKRLVDGVRCVAGRSSHSADAAPSSPARC